MKFIYYRLPINNYTMIPNIFTPSYNQTFKFQSAQYRLRAEFTGQKLNIQLEDLVDWIVYGKQYTEEDIGKQIHKRVWLDQLFQSLMLTEANQASNQTKINKAAAKFGDTIEADEIPCFKIASQGLVTIFVWIVNKIKKQQVKYQSNLKLVKKYIMDQNKIQAEKPIRQIKQLKEDFAQKLQQLSKNNAALKEENKELKNEVDFLKTGYAVLEKKLLLTQKQLNEKCELLKMQSNQQYQKIQLEQVLLNNKLIQQAKKSQQQCQILRQQFKQLRQLLKQSFKQQAKNFAIKTEYEIQKNKLDDLYIDLQTQKNIIKQLKGRVSPLLSQQQQQQQQQQKQKNKNSKVSALLGQSFANKFEVTPTPTSCRVEYLGQNDYTQFIFNQVVPYGQLFIFRLKIVKTRNRYIMIGVVDEAKQKNQRSSCNSKNAVCYYGRNYRKFPSGGKEGVGFSEGETVETTVDLANKTVRWSIAGAIRATQVFDALADKSRTFRPYIELYNTNDIVELMI